MGMTKAKVAHCHEASIVRDVTDPDLINEVLSTLKVGSAILIDTARVYWSWNDKQYYKCNYGGTEEGFINVGLVEV